MEPDIKKEQILFLPLPQVIDPSILTTIAEGVHVLDPKMQVVFTHEPPTEATIKALGSYFGKKTIP